MQGIMQFVDMEMNAKIADLLNSTMVEIDGSQGSTRGKIYEKYLVPPTTAAMSLAEVEGEPEIAVLVWRKALAAAGTALSDPIKKPDIGLLTTWPNGTSLLAIDGGKVDVQVISPGATVRPVDARVKSFPGSNPSFGIEIVHPDLGAPAWFLGIANRISAYSHAKVAPRYRDKIVALLTDE